MITPPNRTNRPTPGQVSIRPRDPASAKPGNGIDPSAFSNSDWEDGHTGEAPINAPIKPPEGVVGVKPFEPPPRVQPSVTPVAPRSVSPVPQARAQMDDIGAAPEEPPLDDVKKAKYVKTVSKDANFIRVDLPSKHVFYDFDDIHVRPFKMKDLAKIWKAMAEKDFSQLIDALDGTVALPVDIRDLLPQDFNFLMYWHRINSYPNSPYTIEWTSKYGNKNKHTVRDTNLDIDLCEMSRDEFAAYNEYGLCAPTMRDAEVLQTEKMTPDQEFLWERAQYVQGDTIAAKLEALDEYPDLNVEEVIHEFAEKLRFGVKESVTVLDTKFDPLTAPKALRDQATKIRQFVEANGEEPVIQVTGDALLEKATEYEAEADDIEAKLAAGQSVQAKEEEITLTLDAMRFFPFNKR